MTRKYGYDKLQEKVKLIIKMIFNMHTTYL